MVTKTNCIVPVNILEKFMGDVFIRLGVPEEEARISAEILITSDLRGIESHGIGRLKMYYDRIRQGTQFASTQMEIVRESPTTAVVDGHHGMGQVTGYRSMSMAIEKAKKYGMGAVAVRNSAHFGIAGYYPLMAIKAGMIGMTFTNARPSIAPTFGVKPMLGTNPIAFGCPTDEEFPFLFDAATSITQRGKLEVLDRLEKNAPEGWVIDQAGGFLTNPGDCLDGFGKSTAALLPLGGPGETLGGHKGYGLATMVEILSASLQTGSFLYGLMGLDEAGQKIPNKLGHFFMAVNIEAFTSLEDFQHTTGEILRELRAATLQPGCERIYTAGEKEFEIEKRVRANGVVVVPNLMTDVKTIITELGMPEYEPYFS
ncbi:MAG: Ldh family oxidoreductase [Anaerolineaceae bacterium]|nr:Ldh family oxidoreductase [Anaerolineaceae bacterium]